MEIENITVGMRIRETCTGDEGYVTEIKKSEWNPDKLEIYVDWVTGNASGQTLSVYAVDIEEVQQKVLEDTSKFHVHHDLIIAWAKGAKIQFSAGDGYSWLNTNKPEWNSDYLYRIQPEEETKYFIGQILTEESDNEKFLIAQVECKKVCLISLVTGNRWYDPIAVKSTLAITKEELKKMSGDLVFKK